METKRAHRKIASFKDIEELVAGHDLSIGGENENGEFVMICAGRTEEGLGRSYQVETAQKNGWRMAAKKKHLGVVGIRLSWNADYIFARRG